MVLIKYIQLRKSYTVDFGIVVRHNNLCVVGMNKLSKSQAIEHLLKRNLVLERIIYTDVFKYI